MFISKFGSEGRRRNLHATAGINKSFIHPIGDVTEKNTRTDSTKEAYKREKERERDDIKFGSHKTKSKVVHHIPLCIKCDNSIKSHPCITECRSEFFPLVCKLEETVFIKFDPEFHLAFKQKLMSIGRHLLLSIEGPGHHRNIRKHPWP